MRSYSKWNFWEKLSFLSLSLGFFVMLNLMLAKEAVSLQQNAKIEIPENSIVIFQPVDSLKTELGDTEFQVH